MRNLPLGFVAKGRAECPTLRVQLNAPATAFGDMWRICSQCCRAAAAGWEVDINPIAVASASLDHRHIPNRCPGYDHSEFIRGILSTLLVGDKVGICPTLVTNCWVEVCEYAVPWPSRQRWIGGGNHICYQMDGTTNCIGKNVPQEHLDNWLKDVESMGYTTENLGNYRPVLESVELAQTGRCFVGVDSGLAQLAYSIGIPVDLVVYNGRRWALRSWHYTSPRRYLNTLRGWRVESNLGLQLSHRTV